MTTKSRARSKAAPARPAPRAYTYLGTMDPDQVERVARAAHVEGVARVVSASGGGVNLCVDVELAATVGDHARCEVLRLAARAAVEAAPVGCGVMLSDGQGNRAIERGRRR